MAIRDLLWGCPLCGSEDRLRTDGRVTSCEACGARFTRAGGARIHAATSDGREQEDTAAGWLDRAPAPRPPAGGDTLGPERAILRIAERPVAFRPAGTFVGWGERFGAKRQGSVTLTPDRLVFEEEGGRRHEWPIDRMTAVQPTSSALQIKTRGEPVAWFKFLDSSVRRWENWIQHRLRSFYRDTGRGEIVEFQPRISTR